MLIPEVSGERFVEFHKHTIERLRVASHENSMKVHRQGLLQLPTRGSTKDAGIRVMVLQPIFHQIGYKLMTLTICSLFQDTYSSIHI